MRPFRKMAFLLEEFGVLSPSQQLLDRFLIGYPRDGAFHRPPGLEVAACLLPNAAATFGDRPEKFHLAIKTTPKEGLRDADAAVIIPRGSGAVANDSLVQTALETAPAGSIIFVYGVLASSLETAHRQVNLAKKRNISLLAGGPLGVTWRLPPIDLLQDTRLAEALIVVQGPSPDAEWHGLEGLLPLIERRKGGEAGIRSIRPIKGKSLWQAGDRGLWSWPLLAAAISRSDALQGDSVADGRTQDIVGLGLLPTLAREPRGWLLEHRDGLRSAILVLDGALADFNFSLRTRSGSILSAQLYRPPPPNEHHLSQLAAALEDFFRSGQRPWPLERNLLIAGLLEKGL